MIFFKPRPYSYEQNKLRFSYIKKRYGSFLSFILTKILPYKTKRLIFLSSILAGIKNITNPDKQLLRKVNEVLEISRIDEAIALPMHYGDAIWSRLLPEGIYLKYLKYPVLQLSDLDKNHLTTTELRIIANAILNSTPVWMKYGSRRTMRNDLFELIDILPELETAQ